MPYGPMCWGRIIQSRKGWVGDISYIYMHEILHKPKLLLPNLLSCANDVAQNSFGLR